MGFRMKGHDTAAFLGTRRNKRSMVLNLKEQDGRDHEIITLAIFVRWSHFTSERDFYRYASSPRS